MAEEQKKTGKRIDELDLVDGGLTPDTLFAVSKENLTRHATLTDLVDAFGEYNLYYTMEDVDALINALNIRLNDLLNDYNSLLNQFGLFKDEINTKFNTLSNLVEERYNELNARIDGVTADLNAFKTETNNKINAINARIDDLFDYGTAVPSSLRTGKFYLQYF